MLQCDFGGLTCPYVLNLMGVTFCFTVILHSEEQWPGARKREKKLKVFFFFFFSSYFFGTFCLYSDRTAEEQTGKGAERGGNDTQQRADGGIRTSDQLQRTDSLSICGGRSTH